MLAWLVRLLFLVASLMYTTVQADSRNHVRVVLDLSKSMKKNDPGGMAILSTLLLYDLAKPSIGQLDTFKVIPFHANWEWNDPGLPLPTHNAPVITAKNTGRAKFISEIRALQYEANCTHFYPGLYAAINDLQGQGKKEDTHTIVLVTDGLPDNPCVGSKPTQEAEALKIRTELVPKLEQNNIRLYVLAFGPEAVSNEGFFKEMTQQDTLGQVFIENNGEGLLQGMLALFAASLGYDVDGPLALPLTALKLNDAGNMPRAAVVVFNPKTSTTPANPAITLTPPSGSPAGINLDGGYISETAPRIKIAAGQYGTPGAAYTLAWILNPENNAYGFNSSTGQGTVAILRPNRAALTISPHPSGKQTNDVMAEVPLPLRLDVGNDFGGTPGREVNIQLLWKAPGINQNNHDTPDGPLPAPAIPPKKPGGQVYTLPFRLPKNPNNPAASYQAFIEAKAYKGVGGRLLGELVIPYQVTVHPFLSIIPSPETANAGNPLSKDGNPYCKSFVLQMQGNLPELPGNKAGYIVKATLNVNPPNVIDQEFKGATFELDKLPLQFNASSSLTSPSNPTANAATAGEWYKGRELSGDKLSGEHEVCINIGKPTTGDPLKNIDLQVRFVLAQAPYDDYQDENGNGVIKPFTFRVTVDKPPLDLGSNVLLITLALLLPLLLWYLRDRPALAPDLGVAIASEDNPAALQSRALGEASLVRSLLGLTLEKPIIINSEDVALAWVRPVDGELYQLRLPAGVRLENADSHEPVSINNGKFATVAVNRVYLLYSPSAVHRLRLEYRL